ncbi:hypothetical protein E2320_000906 [Naja naja]|nr:hypothetical protein E2320_000906 [Naja naja]
MASRADERGAKKQRPPPPGRSHLATAAGARAASGAPLLLGRQSRVWAAPERAPAAPGVRSRCGLPGRPPVAPLARRREGLAGGGASRMVHMAGITEAQLLSSSSNAGP